MGLLLIFTIGLISGIILFLWMHTPNGKRWVEGY